ncbi:MAG: DUF2244 domain-containing protein [Alphaproteobacteria bacterium]|nr:DUF2244 domain-containing protein [Alphaproteobacteria bacterium]
MSTPSPTGGQQTFKATLTPHRSLSPSGFLILMSAVAVISFIVGVAFLLMGAWPVLGFFGLDVALIYWAFRRNYRSGLAYETIEVSPHHVVLTRTLPNGEESVVGFNTYWVRLALQERADGRSHLDLTQRDRTARIADFLSDAERREFADVLAAELFAARNRTNF